MNTQARPGLRLVALCAAIILVAGCGGGDDAPSPAPAPALPPDVALLGDLAAPAAASTTTEELLAALSGLVPPDSDTEFPADLLPPT